MIEKVNAICKKQAGVKTDGEIPDLSFGFNRQ
jgi:hypothetical protein